MAEQFREELVFFFVSMQSSEGSCRLVGNSCVGMSGIEAAQIASLAKLVDTVFFLLFFAEELSPSWRDALKKTQHSLESLFPRWSVELQNFVNLVLSAD